MADTYITSTNFTSSIVQLWASVALEALKPNFVMASLVNRAYDQNPGDVGQSVTISYPPKDVSGTINLAEGGSVELDANNINSSTVTLNQHTTKAFSVPQASQNLLNVDLVHTILNPYIYAVARQIETTLLGLVSGSSNTPVGVGGTGLTSAIINGVETTLFNAEVPTSEQKYLIIDGTNFQNLRGLPEFAYQYAFGENQQMHSGSPDGFLAYGMDIRRSQLVSKTNAGSPVVTTNHGVGFAKDAFCLVTRKLPDPLPGTGTVAAEINDGSGFGMRLLHTFNATTLSNMFVLDVLWGAAVLRPDYSVAVLA